MANAERALECAKEMEGLKVQDLGEVVVSDLLMPDEELMHCVDDLARGVAT